MFAILNNICACLVHCFLSMVLVITPIPPPPPFFFNIGKNGTHDHTQVLFPTLPVLSAVETLHYCSKVETQVQQQRAESPTVTLTWHACKYTYLWWSLCTCIYTHAR